MKQIKLFGEKSGWGNPLKVKLNKTDEERCDEVDAVWAKGIEGEKFDMKVFMFLRGE